MYEIGVLPKHSGDFTIEHGISTNKKMYSSYITDLNFDL